MTRPPSLPRSGRTDGSPVLLKPVSHEQLLELLEELAESRGEDPS